VIFTKPRVIVGCLLGASALIGGGGVQQYYLRQPERVRVVTTEKRVEVPVIKTIYVDNVTIKTVFVDRPIEKIVERIVYVDNVTYVDRWNTQYVERIVYVPAPPIPPPVPKPTPKPPHGDCDR
jgi:hypothetical protein